MQCSILLFAKFLGKLKTAYKSILERVGDPLEDGVLYGPLHNQQAVDKYKVYAKVPISFKRSIKLSKSSFLFFVY